jgi:hypothetical protein
LPTVTASTALRHGSPLPQPSPASDRSLMSRRCVLPSTTVQATRSPSSQLSSRSMRKPCAGHFGGSCELRTRADDDRRGCACISFRSKQVPRTSPCKHLWIMARRPRTAGHDEGTLPQQLLSAVR